LSVQAFHKNVILTTNLSADDCVSTVHTVLRRVHCGRVGFTARGGACARGNLDDTGVGGDGDTARVDANLRASAGETIPQAWRLTKNTRHRRCNARVLGGVGDLHSLRREAQSIQVNRVGTVVVSSASGNAMHFHGVLFLLHNLRREGLNRTLKITHTSLARVGQLQIKESPTSVIAIHCHIIRSATGRAEGEGRTQRATATIIITSHTSQRAASSLIDMQERIKADVRTRVRAHSCSRSDERVPHTTAQIVLTSNDIQSTLHVCIIDDSHSQNSGARTTASVVED